MLRKKILEFIYLFIAQTFIFSFIAFSPLHKFCRKWLFEAFNNNQKFTVENNNYEYLYHDLFKQLGGFAGFIKVFISFFLVSACLGGVNFIFNIIISRLVKSNIKIFVSILIFAIVYILWIEKLFTYSFNCFFCFTDVFWSLVFTNLCWLIYLNYRIKPEK